MFCIVCFIMILPLRIELKIPVTVEDMGDGVKVARVIVVFVLFFLIGITFGAGEAEYP